MRGLAGSGSQYTAAGAACSACLAHNIYVLALWQRRFVGFGSACEQEHRAFRGAIAVS
eukprot:m.310307 g.310307  ORF g.310307 m.310307 type:complete len:58 (-) comp24848_c0_seq1:20-193(-)